jgi:hypothetical protein
MAAQASSPQWPHIPYDFLPLPLYVHFDDLRLPLRRLRHGSSKKLGKVPFTRIGSRGGERPLARCTNRRPFTPQEVLPNLLLYNASQKSSSSSYLTRVNCLPFPSVVISLSMGEESTAPISFP